jgi:uncharacterized protein
LGHSLTTDKRMAKEKEKNSQDSGLLLKRLEKQLDEIETAEIMHDMTPETLDAKGFTSKKAVEIKRSSQTAGTEKEHLVMAEGVEFIRLADSEDFDSLAIESLIHLKYVKKGQLIATRNADEQSAFGPGKHVLKNVNGSTEYYGAEINGFVVIHKNALHIFPSDVDCVIRLCVSSDKMHVFMDCTPGYCNGKRLEEFDVKAKLKELGVNFGIDEKSISEAVGRANGLMEKRVAIPIAQGIQPIQGKDGKVEYAFSTEPLEYDFRILPDGKIDYKSSTNILMAQKDMLLARIIDPQEGVPGTNVFSEKINAETGKPAFCTAGNGVRKSEDGKEFYAEINGSIMLNGTVLEVVNTYVVNGDVDYSTGNIQFNGNVVINGTIPDGFEVKADGDIVVLKIVESARLEAGRDIIIKGGVQGKGKGLISAGRDLRTEYAQNARLEAEGNIYIDNFAINSYIFTTKCLIMQNKKGAVIGGEVFAQRGIDVKYLGSETGVKTTVDAGNDYLVLRKLSELDQAIEFCRKNVRKIEESLRPLFNKVKSGEGITDSMKPMIAKAIEKKKNLERQQEVMIAKRSDLLRQSQELDACFVKVSQACYPDVMIKIKEYKKGITAIRENVRFYEDKKTGEIAVAGY